MDKALQKIVRHMTAMSCVNRELSQSVRHRTESNANPPPFFGGGPLSTAQSDGIVIGSGERSLGKEAERCVPYSKRFHPRLI